MPVETCCGAGQVHALSVDGPRLGSDPAGQTLVWAQKSIRTLVPTDICE
jgi:hypothetical protein